MNERRLVIGIGMVLMLARPLLAVSARPADGSPPASGSPTVSVLVSGLQGGSGSTIGPDGALYVTESAAGRVSRVDPQTGQVTTFASGLPKENASIGFGGPVDVAFINKTPYVLVTLVDDDVGGNHLDGIYRVDGPDSFTVVADIGEFNEKHPPTIPFEVLVASGVQYTLQPFRDGFLVTDGHLNRVLHVTLSGEISVLRAFNDIVPTGLAVSGNTVYMAEAGPVPHLPQNGKVVAFRKNRRHTREVASGASLLVDVRFDGGHRLYALSQGPGVPGAPPGSPAQPNTGALVKANREEGTFTVITDGLDRPTSFQFIGGTAYVVTLTGDILMIDNAAGPPDESRVEQ